MCQSRKLIVQVQNVLGGGVDSNLRKQVMESLARLFESLTSLQKSVQERQTKLSVLQQVSSSEKTFNEDMTRLCTKL